MTEAEFLGTLWGFLQKGRAHGYAGTGEVAEDPMRPGFTLYYYGEEIAGKRWEYHDSYAGSSRFGGSETIWIDEIPTWQMVYFGGMSKEFRNLAGTDREAKDTFSALKVFMQKESPAFQPRGPQEGSFLSWRYKCFQLNESRQVTGDPWDIREFRGEEHIHNVNDAVIPRHTCHFHGGLLIG